MTELLLYNSAGVIVAQKPSGVPVHHSREHLDADRALLQMVRDAAGERVYTVHRLDRATSGAVLFGRSPEVATALRAALADERAEKWYLALCKGALQRPLSCCRPLTNRDNGKVQAARSTFWPLASVSIPGPHGEACLVRARIFTGRRHQIRRHLNHLRHQILCDSTYGKGRINRHVREVWQLPRLALHAERIVLPWDGGTLDLRAPLPTDLTQVLQVSGLATDAERAGVVFEPAGEELAETDIKRSE